MSALVSTGRVVLALLAVLFGVAGTGARLGAATVTDRLPLYLLAGLAAFCAAYLLGLLLVTRRAGPDQRRRVLAVWFCAGTALVAGAFAWTALLPMEDPRLPPAPRLGNGSGSFLPARASPTSVSPPRSVPVRRPSSSCMAARASPV